MIKQNKLTLIVSICSIAIAALSLILSFIVYRDSRTVSFRWETNSRNDIAIKLIKEHYKDDHGKSETYFHIPIWLELKIANTGRTTFSIDSIFIFTSSVKDIKVEQYGVLNNVLFRSSSITGGHPIDTINLPVVVEPGHSKVMLSTINLRISESLYKEYLREFKGKEFTLGDIYRLQNKNLRLGRRFRIFSEVELSGGERKISHVDIDGEPIP